MSHIMTSTTTKSMQNLLHLQVENVRVDIYTLRELQVTKSPKSRDKRRQWHALFVQRNLVETSVGIEKYLPSTNFGAMSSTLGKFM